MNDVGMISNNTSCQFTNSDYNISSVFLEDPCNISLITTSSVCCFAYILFISLLYLKCSSYGNVNGFKDGKTGLLFGHTIRAVLSLILVLVFMVESSLIIFGEKHPLTGYVEITATLLSWILSQFFYSKLECIGELRYIFLTAVCWFICTVSRCVQMNYVILIINLNVEYVRFHTSILSSLLCFSLSLCDWATIFYQIKLSKRFQHDSENAGDSKYVRYPECNDFIQDENCDVGDRNGDYVYNHSYSNWYGKLTFCWLNNLLKAGYANPLEPDDLGVLPDKEGAEFHFTRFKTIWLNNGKKSLWVCYFQSYWKNFVIGGILKLFGDCIGFIGPLGIAIVLRYINEIESDSRGERNIHSSSTLLRKVGNDEIFNVTVEEFLSNGFVMSVIVLTSGIAQATFSQASTHILNVEGIRLKTALQGLVYWKLLRLSTDTIIGNDDRISDNKTKIEDKTVTGNQDLGNRLVENVKLVSDCEKLGTDLKTVNKISGGNNVNCNSGENLSGEESVNDGNNNNSVTNLLSDDVYNIMSCYWIGHYIWAIPLKILILMYLLYWKLGISAVIGAMTCIIFVLPLQFIIGKKMSSNTKAISACSDRRLWQINEVLQGIRLLKLCGWEMDYCKRLSLTRSKELDLLDKDSFYWAVMTFLTHFSSIFITLVTFIIYHFLENNKEKGGSLSPDSVFSSLALFNQLTVPLFIFPITIPIIISAQVSTKRLEKFLKLPEIMDITSNRTSSDRGSVNVKENVKNTSENNDSNERRESVFGLMDIAEKDENVDQTSTNNPKMMSNFDNATLVIGDNINHCNGYSYNGEVVVTVSNAQFTRIYDGYNEDKQHSRGGRKSDGIVNNKFLSLYVKHLQIKKGKLSIIIGKIGSGKSSLLKALLGEMKCVSGLIMWNGYHKVAYVSQKPWLMNGSLRDNILFGRPFKEYRYKRVVSVCALQQDIDLLPFKDATEIVGQGLNLSGGQRQRVSIARALYASASVILLDDPLSALDFAVAEHVFTNGIENACLKYNKTVIMVTHSYRFMSRAHQVIAMENNMVSSCGDLGTANQHCKNAVNFGSNDIPIQNFSSYIYNKEKDVLSRGEVRTAKERWHLIKLISSLGLQLKKQKNNVGTSQDTHEHKKLGYRSLSFKHQETVFIPFRKRLATFSGSRYLAHDLLLPTDECDEDNDLSSRRRRNRSGDMLSSSFGQHKTVLRATSLQTDMWKHPVYVPPVMRQSSSPNINPMAYSCSLPSSMENGVPAQKKVNSFRIRKWMVSNGSPPVSSENRITRSNSNDVVMNSGMTAKKGKCYIGNVSIANSGCIGDDGMPAPWPGGNRVSHHERVIYCRGSGRDALLRQLLNKSVRSFGSRNGDSGSCKRKSCQVSKCDRIDCENDDNEEEGEKKLNLEKTTSDGLNNCTEEDDENSDLQDNKESFRVADDLDSNTDGNNRNYISFNTEEREYGKISHTIYFVYVQVCGIALSVSYVASTILWQMFRIATDFWLSKWSSSNPLISSLAGKSSQTGVDYLMVYAGFSALTVLLSLVSNCLGQYCASRARKRLYNNMLSSLLKCPIEFFEETPLGRIINRFSTDIAVIDKKIGTSIQRLFQFLLLCTSAVIVNTIVTPWFLAITIPIGIVYYTIQKFYRCSSRELQRLESMSRGPVLSHFNETLSGLETIRAFSQQNRFIDLFNIKLDTHTNAFLIFNSANRWLGIALDYLGALIVFLAMFVCLITSSLFKDQISPASVGLAINYTLLMPIYLNWVVKFLSDTEVYMGAVERVQRYADTEPEDYRYNCTIPRCWPRRGDIKFNNVSLCYRSMSGKQEHQRGERIVIKNLTLHISHGQKIGICGRTGSGKSSLVMSLFNMVPIFEGRILIDEQDITEIPLRVLRSKLSIIPQDVIMFSGTIRDNLDVCKEHTDTEIWSCLELAYLKEFVINDLGGLDGIVKEGGINLSIGQRQLFCLARAILSNTVCLVMDEATSSLDVDTERKLLKAAYIAFKERTVITIAHRLDNLLHCDRIIVLDCGKIIEDGSPSYLLSRSMGIFSNMMKNSKTKPVIPPNSFFEAT